LRRSQTNRLSHKGKASNSLKGICSRASDNLQGLEPPYRKVSDLAHRNGDKVAVCTAATCRFLLEAPPLNCVVREGGKHMKNHEAFYIATLLSVTARKMTGSPPRSVAAGAAPVRLGGLPDRFATTLA
jgi:hypothetical protein